LGIHMKITKTIQICNINTYRKVKLRKEIGKLFKSYIDLDLECHVAVGGHILQSLSKTDLQA